jgi:hypothetical protein
MVLTSIVTPSCVPVLAMEMRCAPETTHTLAIKQNAACLGIAQMLDAAL